MRYVRDEEFIRGNCPMTKEEVRILSIAKLELEENHRVLDVGAGTGSVSIQAALICSKGEIVAVERDEDALEVIRQNKEKFNARNLEIVEGDAFEINDRICGMFDSIFIGGSGGSIEGIIKAYDLKLKTGGKFVLNFITLNNLYKAMESLKELKYSVECTQIAVSRTRGQSYMLMANNPIFIVDAKKK